MRDYQKRVVREKEELDRKITKLEKFMDSETYRDLRLHERSLLTKQFEVMVEYSKILDSRIDLFK